jgi:uncharacterized membrane protein
MFLTISAKPLSFFFFGSAVIILCFLSLVFAEVVYRHKDNAWREE